MESSVHVRAPATSANLGPAFDAAGIALDWWDELEVRPAPVDAIQLSGEQAELLSTGRDNLIRVAMRRLAHYLAEQGAGGPQVEANNVQAIQQLTEPVKSVVLHAFTNALDDVFLIGVPFVAVAIVVALLLKEEPLRTGQP